MKKPLVLDPFRTYVYPVMSKDNITITEVVHYGGEKSESVPCGFIAEFKYSRKPKRKLGNRLRAVANKLDVPSSTNKKS